MEAGTLFKHVKRVAHMSVCVAEQMGIQGESLLDLTCCTGTFTSDTWKKVEDFLQAVNGSVVDEVFCPDRRLLISIYKHPFNRNC